MDVPSGLFLFCFTFLSHAVTGVRLSVKIPFFEPKMVKNFFGAEIDRENSRNSVYSEVLRSAKIGSEPPGGASGRPDRPFLTPKSAILALWRAICGEIPLRTPPGAERRSCGKAIFGPFSKAKL